MEHRVFLGKYRVATTKSVRWWETRRSHLGLIYEAEEIASGQKFALELIPLFLLGESERAELRRAARAASQIRHRTIPTLHEFGEEGEQFVTVAEEVSGMTAPGWIAAHGPMPIAAALGLALQVASALRVAARHDLYHPTLHPGNLMILPGQPVEGGGPLVKVVRFLGPQPSSRALDLSNPTFTDAITFASPEQIAHGQVDFRSEIYSLGGILWFLLSGAPPVAPFRARERKRTADSDSGIREFADLPASVPRLLEGMLAENPDERPTDPTALEEQIRVCLSEVATATETEKVRPPIKFVRPERARERPVPAARQPFSLKLLATAAAAFLTAGVLAFLILPHRFQPGWSVESQAQQEPQPFSRGVPARDDAVAESARFPQAMNFAVVAPSYQIDSSQIRSVLAPDESGAQKPSLFAEPESPGEGPDDPAVEIPTNTPTRPALGQRQSSAAPISRAQPEKGQKKRVDSLTGPSSPSEETGRP